MKILIALVLLTITFTAQAQRSGVNQYGDNIVSGQRAYGGFLGPRPNYID